MKEASGRCAAAAYIRVLRAKFLDRTEVGRALRARGDARGIEPLFESVDAGVALAHLERFEVELRGAVGQALVP